MTVKSFRNLLLKNQKHPVMIGPMLVHHRKLFSTYHFFASSLVSLNQSLADLKAFGTDGEECLCNVFDTQFSQVCHVRCFLHFRENCKAKLQEMNDGVADLSTNGKECLYNAFGTQFSQACHVWRFLHSREDCKAKLQEMMVSNDGVVDIIQDVLGSFLKGKSGLVDASTSVELKSQLHSLKTKNTNKDCKLLNRQ